MTPSNFNNGSDVVGQNATCTITETWRPRSHFFRKCPFDGCGKQFKTKKDLLRHFELRKSCLFLNGVSIADCVFGIDVECNEVCVECFRRFTHVSALMKHVKSHSYSSDRKRRFMLGLCDDLRDKAISELDRMIETLKPSIIDADLKTTKRDLELTDPVQDLSSPKRVKVRREDERGLLSLISDKTTRGMDLPLYYSRSDL